MNSAIGPRQDFIDWLKASGMLLILIGHVVGGPDVLFNAVSVPIYSKQLGVAFFVFAAGWSLANDRRPALRAVFARAFPLCFWGLACALLLSVIYWFSKGTINKSNYLPLMGGINVFFNFFPANPTTWYIGMYLHLLLFWLWLAPRRVQAWHLGAALLLELIVRAVLLGMERPFTGYMLLSNWLTVFLLGVYLRQQGDQHRLLRAMLLLVVWLGLLAIWPRLFTGLGFDSSFPTRLATGLEASAGGAGTIAVVSLSSLLVSTVYIANTLLAFALFRALPANGVVRFVARNTLLIFILHMPVIYGYAGVVYGLVDPVWLKKGLMVVLLLVGLGLVSEVMNRWVPVGRLRELVWQRLHQHP